MWTSSVEEFSCSHHLNPLFLSPNALPPLFLLPFFLRGIFGSGDLILQHWAQNHKHQAQNGECSGQWLLLDLQTEQGQVWLHCSSLPVRRVGSNWLPSTGLLPPGWQPPQPHPGDTGIVCGSRIQSVVQPSLWPKKGVKMACQTNEWTLIKQARWYTHTEWLCIVRSGVLNCHQQQLSLFPAPSFGSKEPCHFANGEILEKWDMIVRGFSKIHGSLKENTRAQCCWASWASVITSDSIALTDNWQECRENENGEGNSHKVPRERIKSRGACWKWQVSSRVGKWGEERQTTVSFQFLKKNVMQQSKQVGMSWNNSLDSWS